MKLEDFKKLKKGDKVKIIENRIPYWNGFKIGTIAIVKAVDCKGSGYDIEVKGQHSDMPCQLSQTVTHSHIELVSTKSVQPTKFNLWGIAEKTNDGWIPRQSVIYSTRKEARKNAKSLNKLFINPNRKFKVIKIHIDTKEKA